jgi:hypothetical protein
MQVLPGLTHAAPRKRLWVVADYNIAWIIIITGIVPNTSLGSNSATRRFRHDKRARRGSRVLLGASAKALAYYRSPREVGKAGCEGRLRSRPSAKLPSIGRETRRLPSPSQTAHPIVSRPAQCVRSAADCNIRASQAVRPWDRTRSKSLIPSFNQKNLTQN